MLNLPNPPVGLLGFGGIKGVPVGDNKALFSPTAKLEDLPLLNLPIPPVGDNRALLPTFSPPSKLEDLPLPMIPVVFIGQ